MRISSPIRAYGVNIEINWKLLFRVLGFGVVGVQGV